MAEEKPKKKAAAESTQQNKENAPEPAKKPKKKAAPEPTPQEDDAPEQEGPSFFARMGDAVLNSRFTKWVVGTAAVLISIGIQAPKKPEKPKIPTEPTPIVKTADPKNPTTKTADQKTTPKVEPKAEEKKLSPEEIQKKNIEAWKDTEFNLSWSFTPDANKAAGASGLTGKLKTESCIFENGKYIVSGKYERKNSAGGKEEGSVKYTITPEGKLTVEMTPKNAKEPTIIGDGQVATQNDGLFCKVGKDGKLVFQHNYNNIPARGSGEMTYTTDSGKFIPAAKEALNFSTQEGFKETGEKGMRR